MRNLDRREFLTKSGSACALTVATASGLAIPMGHHADATVTGSGHLDLANDLLAWHLEWREGRLRSTAFENKRSTRRFALSSVNEISIRLSTAKHRVDIPWWKFLAGPDDAAVEPPQEQGFRLGYHKPEFPDREWGAVENLLLRSPRGAKNIPEGITYGGYGWFRCRFALPREGQHSDVVFVLGGYDYLDWNEYWMYVNGTEIGYRTSSGRWRTPGQCTVSPGTPAHDSIRFGPEEQNVLAIRTRGYDKHFGGISDEALRHYVFQPILVDQFLSIGRPYADVSDFEVEGLSRQDQTKAVFELRSPSHGITLSARYELDGATRRKSVEMQNPTESDLLLLDVSLDDFVADAATSEGGLGEPVFIGEEAFCGIEHPAALNRGDHGRVSLQHFPGRRLPAGGSIHSRVALLSVAAQGTAREHFTNYIQEKSPRSKKAISLYTPYGINNQWGGCPPLADTEMIDVLKRLEQWQRQGLKFDYFTLDQGWVDPTSDLKRFAPQCYPDGPAQVIERVHALGMKFGLWFSVTWGGWSCGEYPPVWPSRIPAPGESGESTVPAMLYRNGYLADGGVAARLCVASEPYFSILREAILYHIRENGLKFFKLDMGNYYCNSSRHDHLPGKYSVEATYDRLLDIAEAARAAAPDVYVMWYWGSRSPFFALHGDSIFESGLFMEGAGTSWYPTLYFRDSVALNLDQSTQFAETIPAINKDSLGVWLADTRWGNFMGKERWKEALIMDLGRGSLLFPQIWGDIYLLDDEDVRFLAGMDALVRKNQQLFVKRRNILGDPWKNDVYGYAYSVGSRGFLFINNIHFASRKARLHLDASVGLEANRTAPLSLVSHFPERKQIMAPNASRFNAGDTVDLWVRPFEVLMLEVSPGDAAGDGLPSRKLLAEEAANLGIPLSLEPIVPPAWMEMQFADSGRFEKEGKRRISTFFSARLPALSGESILAVEVRLQKDDTEWRYSPAVVEIVQVVARINEQPVHLIPVPDARQYGNTQKAGASWVVYKMRLNPGWSQGQLRFAVHAYLPEGVDPKIKAWVVKRWWEEATRPQGDGYYGDEPS